MKQSTRITCRSLVLLVVQLLGDWESLFVFTPGMFINQVRFIKSFSKKQNCTMKTYKLGITEQSLSFIDLSSP